MQFAHQVVWVTGASSGIGEQLAYRLAQQGARLVLSARNADRLAQVAAGCGGEAVARVVPLDLAAHDTLERRAAEARAAFGRIDVLVNNAGLSQRARAADTHWSVDERLVDVDYLGPVILTKALLPHWAEREQGHVVVVSSVAGRFGVPLRSGYSGAKFALRGFFEALRAEVAGQGISVTMVYPGFVHTDLSRHALLGDGTPQGTMDAATRAGIPADVCAWRIADAIHAKRREVVIAGFRERLAVLLQRFAPGLLARAIRTARVT